MPLLEQFEAVGNRLFRWRSYLPLVLLLLILSGLSRFHDPFGSHSWDQIWELLCLGISFLGLLIRVLTVGFAPAGTSGRNTKRQAATELNTTGMYSIVRNPLYLGNLLMMLGPMVFLRVWWIPLVYLFLFILCYERIIFAEEMFLRREFGQAYLDWASKTPAFFPRLRQWQSPRLSFSWRTVVRREYHGAFGVIIAIFLIEVVSDLYREHELVVDSMWRWILGLSMVAYLIIRFLHKRTSILRTKGR